MLTTKRAQTYPYDAAFQGLGTARDAKMVSLTAKGSPSQGT